MLAPIEAVDAAIQEAEGLRKILKKSDRPQVRSADEQIRPANVESSFHLNFWTQTPRRMVTLREVISRLKMPQKTEGPVGDE